METIQLFCDLNPTQVAEAYGLGIQQRSYRYDRRRRHKRGQERRNDKAVRRVAWRRSRRTPEKLIDISEIHSVLKSGYQIDEVRIFVAYIRRPGDHRLNAFMATLEVKLRLADTRKEDARLDWIAQVAYQNWRPGYRVVEVWAS